MQLTIISEIMLICSSYVFNTTTIMQGEDRVELTTSRIRQ